jgi:hypothetical protein
VRWLIDRRLLKKLIRSSLCALSVSVLMVSALHAQSDCEASLTRATDEFNAGHFYGLPAILKPCIDSKGFSNEQLVRAYQLLTQTYVILEDPIGAEQSYLNLLRANPEYVSTPERDPIDVVYLSKKFTATPIFSWYANAGGNITIPRIIKNTIVNDGSNQEYTLRPRWTVGGGLIWNVNDQITVEGGINLSNSSFRYFEDGIFVRDDLEMSEAQYSVLLPISLKYTYVRKKLSPYAYAGASLSALLSSRQRFLYSNKTPEYSGPDVVGVATQTIENDFDATFRRTRINQAFHIGAGARLKYKLDYLFVDIRYSFGVNNVVTDQYLVRKEGDPGSDLPVFSVAYADDQFRLDQAVIQVGYIWPLYKPRKLKTARTRSVLRNVKKSGDGEE